MTDRLASDVKPQTPVPARSSNQGLRRLGLVALIVVGLIGGIVWAWPEMLLAFSTVSTDDAYVAGHVTYVASRVPGTILKVHVDDNIFVKRERTPGRARSRALPDCPEPGKGGGGHCRGAGSASHQPGTSDGGRNPGGLQQPEAGEGPGDRTGRKVESQPGDPGQGKSPARACPRSS